MNGDENRPEVQMQPAATESVHQPEGEKSEPVVPTDGEQPAAAEPAARAEAETPAPADLPEAEQPEPAAPPRPPLPQIIEAVLFAADEPVPLSRLADIAGVTPDEARAATDRLNQEYEATGRSFRVHRVAQGFQLYTRPEYAEWVRRLYSRSSVQRLSKAALEVLAIIAYNQPITRPEIERLRNVDCSGPLLTLLERRLVATAGRAHRPGNPFLYRTTREFLRYFGLEKLEDLPRMEELSEFLSANQPGDEPPPRRFDSLAVDLRPPAEPAPPAGQTDEPAAESPALE